MIVFFFLILGNIVFTGIFLSVTLCFQVDCHDYRSNGSHNLIGSFQTTLSQIQQASQTYAVNSALTSHMINLNLKTCLNNAQRIICTLNPRFSHIFSNEELTLE